MADLLSTVQASRLLGISESSIKRLADSGQLESAREGKAARRFPVPALLRYLRERLPRRRPFAEALRAGAADECVVQLIERHLDGVPLARSFDELVAPALGSGVDVSFLERAQPLAERGAGARPRSEPSAVVLAAAPAHACVPMLGCLLRAAAFLVLAPPPAISANDLLAMIHRNRPAVLTIAVRGHAELDPLRPLIEAQRLGGGSVLVRADSVTSELPVRHVRSMEEFAREVGAWPEEAPQRPSARLFTASSTSATLRSAR